LPLPPRLALRGPRGNPPLPPLVNRIAPSKPFPLGGMALPWLIARRTSRV
jgi:hypothetical protein